MGTYTKNLKLETPSYTDNADIPALAKKNNEIIDSEMIKRANGLDYNEQTGVLQLTGNNSKVGSPIQIKNNLPVTSMASGKELKVNNYKQLIKFTKEGKSTQDGTPTPDAPVEIISIPSVENLFDKDNANILNLVVDVASMTSSNNGKSFYIKCNPNTTYTISRKITGSRFVVGTTAKIPTSGETVIDKNRNNSGSSITLTTSPTANYLCVYYLYNSSENEQEILDSIMIEKGSIVHTWRPYGNYLRIDNVGKNLFDKDNAIKRFYYDALGGLSPSENWYYENIRVKPNTSYSISGNTTNNTSAFFVELNKNLELVKIIGNYYNTHNFTTSNETYYVGVSISWYGDSDGRNNINTFQIEQGSATEYEPYRNKVIYVNMQDKKLCSNKDETIKDKLIIYDNGKTEINKKIGEVILDGSESGWERGTSTSGNYYYQLNMENIKPAINNTSICNIKCSHFESKSANDIWTGIKGISVRVNISSVRFCYVNDKTDTLEKWKAYLQEQYNAGNPVKIQYELAEPETIDLGITDFNLLEGNSELTCEDESNMQLDYLTIDSNIFVQDSLDGNSNQKAPSVDAIKKYFGKKVYDKDANGWIKIEFFDHTEYVTEGQITQIDFSTGWGVSKLLSLPVGMSTIGDRILSGNVRTFDAAISVNISAILTETQITYNWKNNHSSNVTTGLNYSLRILEYV